MRLGIIGLPQSGKTTVFNALTRGHQPVSISGGRFEIHTAVVSVPDSRVETLANLFNPQKTTYAKVTYVDIAGLENGMGKSGFPGQLLNQLSQLDGFIHVVRCFENAVVAHPTGSVNPARDFAVIDNEFILNDMILIERRLERLVEERKKNSGKQNAQLDSEYALLEKLHQELSRECSLRDIQLSPDELKLISGFGFLSLKPVMILFNLSDGQEPPDISCPYLKCSVVGLQGKLEMELVQLTDEDAALFMREYQIEELGLNRVINLSYELLGLESFFTVGEDEVRAWTLRRGATTYEAAGAIHTDLQKGFIRAEVISYADLIASGSLSEARAKGKLRLEGRDYIVMDGEIVHIRFNL